MYYPKHQKGFTLIEVLIAMTLLSVMVVLLFGSMKICADSWQKGEDKITQVNEIAVVYQFFHHHLSTAKPYWDDFTDKENKVFSFQGDSQKLQFVSSFPASAKKSGLQSFLIQLLKDGDEQYLQVSIKPFFSPGDGDEWRKEEVTLIRHVRNFSLSYYSLLGDEGVWQDIWVGQTTLPRLVKISIVRDDGAFWPDMLVELKAVDVSTNSDGQALSEEEQAAADAAALQNNENNELFDQ